MEAEIEKKIDTLTPQVFLCLGREVARREAYYPTAIANGRMTREEADKEINLMRKARDTLIVLQNALMRL